MPAHKHAELMLQYAQDAAETDSPWKLWQCRSNRSKTWNTLTEGPRWNASVEYRRKHKTILCNGFEIEAPITDPPPDKYYIPDVSSSDFAYAAIIEGYDRSCHIVSRGILHTTKEAAIAHAKAMLGIDPKGE